MFQFLDAFNSRTALMRRTAGSPRLTIAIFWMLFIADHHA
jgi:hypothetical protein